MEEGKASATAMLTAMFRAAHRLWDDPPKIFEDTLALRLSDCESELDKHSTVPELVEVKKRFRTTPRGKENR